MIKILCLVMCFAALQAKEKYHLSICSIFKDETKYLKEWIEYHRLVGVDHFYLYNNNSKDFPNVTLKNYIKEGIVTLTQWPDHLSKAEMQHPYIWALSTQISSYQHAALTRADETEWMVFLDIDEFLTPVRGENLVAMLENYKTCPGVVLPTECFDASQMGGNPKGNFVIEAVEMIEAPPRILQRGVEKTIFKPKQCEVFAWAPFRCIFKNKQKPVLLDKTDMCVNYYVNREKKYISTTRRSHLDNRLLTDQETAVVLKAGFEIEDQRRPIYRFIPELKKKME